MGAITEWSDDLVGQVAKYGDGEIVVIDEWGNGRYVLAWSFNHRNGLINVPLEQCEATGRRVDKFLCSLVMKAHEMREQAKITTAGLSHALYVSMHDNAPLKEIMRAIVDAKRDAKKLAEQTRELEQLIEHSAPETPRYEYAVQVLAVDDEWKYLYGWEWTPGYLDLKLRPEAAPDVWFRDLNTAQEIMEGTGADDARVVRRVVGEPEVVE
ncbi:hypothetical protein ckrop_1617 [Corynebacterium kroppenstedtii DSM 44385]|uniref:Uncharacterized protein n=2 Tax=Corynebacterium kroppenstedtii TaxID=161879 RepID=C4LKJ0_CORK4|nr:hypothetical protein ckrop_1617 [Corynebacterium kroppenstedtii DSM 44385]